MASGDVTVIMEATPSSCSHFEVVPERGFRSAEITLDKFFEIETRAVCKKCGKVMPGALFVLVACGIHPPAPVTDGG